MPNISNGKYMLENIKFNGGDGKGARKTEMPYKEM
jgi:hypothetical protein